MRIGPAETKSADAGDSLAANGPRHGFRSHLQGRLIPGEMRIGFGKVQARGNSAVPIGEQHLDQSCDSRRRLQMPDIGLYGTDPQRIRTMAVYPVDLCQ